MAPSNPFHAQVFKACKSVEWVTYSSICAKETFAEPKCPVFTVDQFLTQQLAQLLGQIPPSGLKQVPFEWER